MGCLANNDFDCSAGGGARCGGAAKAEAGPPAQEPAPGAMLSLIRRCPDLPRRFCQLSIWIDKKPPTALSTADAIGLRDSKLTLACLLTLQCQFTIKRPSCNTAGACCQSAAGIPCRDLILMTSWQAPSVSWALPAADSYLLRSQAEAAEEQPKRKRGRPPGSKGKPKVRRFTDVLPTYEFSI